MSREDLAAHFEFFEELGVDGIRREPYWRARTDEPTNQRTNEPTDPRTLEPTNQRSDEPTNPRTDEPSLAVFRSPEEALAVLKADIGPDCCRCKLAGLGRTQIVFGVGNPNADLMFVGEDEDVQGEPFVGRAGQLLTKIIEAIGMQREDVFIANVLKCRPPGNRNPEPDEVEQCEPFLHRQIDIVKPKVIVALGKFAAQCLLKTNAPITRLRGQEFKYRDAILMPTYHPAYLLRTPSAKREVWEDMKRVKRILESRNSEPGTGN
jgi:uracil-DNA glycosylase family 4